MKLTTRKLKQILLENGTIILRTFQLYFSCIADSKNNVLLSHVSVLGKVPEEEEETIYRTLS